MFTSDVVMEARASSDLSFIGMWNISFIIMWPLHNQSYCNISMKNGSNVIIYHMNRTDNFPNQRFHIGWHSSLMCLCTEMRKMYWELFLDLFCILNHHYVMQSNSYSLLEQKKCAHITSDHLSKIDQSTFSVPICNDLHITEGNLLDNMMVTLFVMLLCFDNDLQLKKT